MAVTKTNFINYTRCPRYVALDKLKKEKLSAFMTYEEYKNEERQEELVEIYNNMYEVDEDGEEIDLIDVENPKLSTMMKYYKKVEDLAGLYIEKTFGGTTIYAASTFNQQKFEYNKNDIKYLCYVDIYNESNGNINIIEVKATTSKKYVDLVSGHRGGEKYSIFQKIGNIYYLKDELDGYKIEDEMPLEGYQKQKMKLFDINSGAGKYVYDLSIQRFIIENSKKEDKVDTSNIKYYLAVLNHEYIFDGEYIGDEPNYKTDANGQEIITLFDLTKVTEEYQAIIKDKIKFLEEYIKNMDVRPCPLNPNCEYKKQTECKFFKRVCGAHIPSTNSSLNYMNNGQGFKDELGIRHKGLDLINEGYLHLLDIPESWITNPNHFIQRDALKNDQVYIDKKKIKDILVNIKYPLYHFDFETFPCPLPRYKGEKCYTQSPFEFSLHIETSPGVCDKEKDNYVFLANDHSDCRLDMVKEICRLMDGKKGTLFAQNVSFEKSRLKELAECFPEYKNELLSLVENSFDLIYILKTKSDFYTDIGYDSESAKKVNFYHKDMSGSYSIKKTLPVFTNLSYKDLEIHNGNDALIEYANFPNMDKEQLERTRENLRLYCQQDTWAMVEILNSVRKKVNT